MPSWGQFYRLLEWGLLMQPVFRFFLFETCYYFCNYYEILLKYYVYGYELQLPNNILQTPSAVLLIYWILLSIFWIYFYLLLHNNNNINTFTASTTTTLPLLLPLSPPPLFFLLSSGSSPSGGDSGGGGDRLGGESRISNRVL